MMRSEFSTLGVMFAMTVMGCSSTHGSDGPIVDGSGSSGSGGATARGPGATTAANATATAGAGGQGNAGGSSGGANAGDCPGRPTLIPGVWTNITPSGVDLPMAPPPFGIAFVELDPSNPCTLYITCDEAGAWRTSDAGSTWTRLGTPPSAPTYGTTATYLDSPIAIKVDPKDPKHLYATQGVRGTTLGFWVSHDGGDTWAQPPGFVTVAATTTSDVTSISVDPTDFAHLLVGSHSAWPGLTNAGILESKDGGDSWIVHAPIAEFNPGSMGINFLYDPSLGLGDSQTWLVGTDGNGLWRTTDSGANFTRVTPAGVWPDFSIAHGGQQVFYASDGTVYTGGFVYPSRSTDNGVTWTSLSTLPYATYYSIIGDGKNLYTQVSFTGDNGGHGLQSYFVSPESDGLDWQPYDPLGTGPQTFTDGPFMMRFDAANGILYSANWDAGLWALKVTN